MTRPVEADPVSTAGRTPSYSAGLRRVFNFAAFVVALLPVPVVYFQLLPAYRIHSYFLIFYAPVVCLLTLGYLFYVRDALARTMFADLLDPLPEPLEIYPDRPDVRTRRWVTRLKSTVLLLLPAVLLLVSVACILRYTTLLKESVVLARVALADRLTPPEDVGVLAPGSSPEPASGGVEARRGRATSKAPADTVAPEPLQSAPATDTGLRQRTLEIAGIDEIPYFTELTVLFILAFLSPLVALVLMGLREYAREALGLSERDVVLGRPAPE
jgi:hypothetical protein